ncbi:MAG: hypothetical protein WCO69_01245 [Candidatus Omnitrophota bacterium]
MNKKGSVLAVTLLLVIILATLGAALFLTGVNEAFTLKRKVLSTQAFWLAEAGLHRVAWNAKANNCYGMINEETGFGCMVCNACGKGNLKLTGSLPQGEYAVTFDPVAKLITSDGAVPSFAKPAYQRRLMVYSRKKQLYGLGAFSSGLENPVRSMYDLPVEPAAAPAAKKSGPKAETYVFEPYDWQEAQ